MRHADRRTGLEHRPDGADGRGLARDGVRHHGRPPVRLLDADELQRGRRGVVGPARRRRLGRRRDDVARPDGLERRRPLGQAARPLADRPSGDLGGGDCKGVGPHPRGARRLLARVSPPRGRCDRRGPIRERDRARRGLCSRRRRPRRRRRGAEARHVGREARVVAARVHPRRCRHGRQLESDRRRRRRRLVTSEAAASRLGLEPRARFVSFGLSGVDPHRMLHGNPEACRKALARAGLPGTTSPWSR